MEKPQKKLIIAIDGYSSCGKSTIAKDLAMKIGYTYIDSGAMYRVITLFSLRNNLINDDIVDQSALKEQIHKVTISFKYNQQKKRHETFMNGELVEDQIRSLEISNHVSAIAKIRFVREKLVALQREMSKGGAVIMDGRDIGTVVFPNADLKIFMTAQSEVRAMRRYKELTAKGDNITLEEIQENVKKRDYIDENREESPLRQAPDALVLDNSNLTPIQQLEWIIDRVSELES